MKVLVIPDVHLKSDMFRNADVLMREKKIDQAVCLMDIADDWNKGNEIGLYEKTYNEAIKFAKTFPTSLWCYGNHELAYRWQYFVSGYSQVASLIVQKKILELQQALPENAIKYVHRIDNVLFSHGGLHNWFIEKNVQRKNWNNVDLALEEVNKLGQVEMWNDASPIWLRPQNKNIRLYKPRKYLQVVGHTPVKTITKQKNVISCDVFSTYRDETPIGTQEYLLLDTLTWDYRGIKL